MQNLNDVHGENKMLIINSKKPCESYLRQFEKKKNQELCTFSGVHANYFYIYMFCKCFIRKLVSQIKF